MKTTVADWATFLRHAPRAVLLAAAVFGLATIRSVAAAPPSAQESAAQREHGAGQFWSPVAEDTLGAPDPTRRIEGREYRVLRLDRRRLADLLARAPLQQPDRVTNAQVVMELPWPDGSFKTFRIEEAVNIGPGLTVQCPDVKTYLGRTSDRAGHAHFEWSGSGLRAVVSANNRQVYIAPYSPRDTQNYIVYYARDWRPLPEERTEAAPAVLPGALGPSPAVSVPPARPPAAAIEEIAIQRGCFGCGNAYKLTFQRDGTATLMRMGVLAFGALDHRCRGSVRPEAFATLAAVLQREGFFDLAGAYRSRAVDGQWATTSAVVSGRRKAVDNNNDAGPPNLKVVEDAVDALGEKVTWTETRP